MPANTAVWVGLGFNANATGAGAAANELGARIVVPVSKTFTTLYAFQSASNIANPVTVQVYVDGTAVTGASCTIAANTSTCTATGLSIPVTAGHQIDVKVSESSNFPAEYLTWGVGA